jgi:GNAT superfamily N-acetyltransferase
LQKRLDRKRFITFSIVMEQIAQATMEDILQLCDLLALLFKQEADFIPDRARQERALRLILGQPETGRIFCARFEGRVTGMVSLLFTISTAEGGRAAWLEDMVVHPDWRGKGLGNRLLQYALAAGKTQGCSRVTLLTDGDNRPAMRFYERAGFERSSMVPFRLKL